MKRIWIFTTLLILTACAAAELPTPSPSPSSTATLTPSATPTPTTTPSPSNTPLPTNTPTIQPIPSDCEEGVVLFSARADVEIKEPQSGLYVACANGAYLRQVLSTNILKWPQTTLMHHSFAVSHDGKQAVVSVIDQIVHPTQDNIYTGSLYLFDLVNYSFEEISTADYWMIEPTMSADDEYLVYFAGADRVETEIEILHLDTLTISRITDSGWLPIESLYGYQLYDLDWLPDGKQIYYSADTVERAEKDNISYSVYDYSWQLLDISCDPQTHLCKPVDNHELGWIPDLTYTLSWLQDGSGILSIHYFRVDPEEEIYTYVIAFRSSNGTILREIELEGYSPPKGYGGVRDAVLSPDGKRIAFIADESEDNSTRLGEVLILSLEDMSVINLTEDPMFDDVGPGEVYWLP